MSEDSSNSPTRMSLAEIQLMGIIVFEGFSACLMIIMLNVNVLINPIPGFGALLFVLFASLALIVLFWKVGQRENPPFWYCKNVGFWLVAISYVAGIAVLVLMAVFQIILSPSALTSAFISNLPFVSLGLLLFMAAALIIWFAQVNLLKARRDLQHWLDTGEL